MPLSCGLAYDVGYFYGIKNPDKGIGYGKTVNMSDDVLEGCFTTDGTSRKLGFLVGIQDGRETANRAGS